MQAAVEHHEVEALYLVVVGREQTLRAERAVVGVLVESVLLRDGAKLFLHHVLVVSGVETLWNVVEVGHLVVVVAGNVDDGA